MVLRRYVLSSNHRQAVEMTIAIPTSTIDIGELLSLEYAKEKLIQQKYVD